MTLLHAPACSLLGFLLVVALWGCSEESTAPAPEVSGPRPGDPSENGTGSAPGTDFIRHLTPMDAGARLETAISIYEDEAGRRVDLVAAIHIGDQAYFDTLDVVFRGYDAVLYEMVKDEDASPVREPGGPESLISMAQRMMKDVLALEFQLDAVDYSVDNFVHADLDPGSFQRKQEEQGESLFTLLLNSAVAQMAQESEDPQQSRAQQLSLFLALVSTDRASALKRVLAGQFIELEAIAAGFGANEEGSVLLEGRNERAFEVLDEQLAAGDDKLAVFYGAAHLPDMEKRLIARGFELKRQAWVTAWDVP